MLLAQHFVHDCGALLSISFCCPLIHCPPPQVNFLDVLGCFAMIPEEKLCLVFEGLQREGLLQVGARTLYR
jgi:hypothetical protein